MTDTRIGWHAYRRKIRNSVNPTTYSEILRLNYTNLTGRADPSSLSSAEQHFSFVPAGGPSPNASIAFGAQASNRLVVEHDRPLRPAGRRTSDADVEVTGPFDAGLVDEPIAVAGLTKMKAARRRARSRKFAPSIEPAAHPKARPDSKSVYSPGRLSLLG